MRQIPAAGEFYQHFKHKLYQIIAIAYHSETGEEMVVYQALYDDFKIYVRPLSMFVSEVDREKHPEAEQKYRFEKVILSKQQAPEEKAKEEPKHVLEEPRLSPHILSFLEEDNIEKRLQILGQMRETVSQRELDNLYLALDMKEGSGLADQQLDEIASYLRMQMQYDGSRLR